MMRLRCTAFFFFKQKSYYFYLNIFLEKTFTNYIFFSFCLILTHGLLRNKLLSGDIV